MSKHRIKIVGPAIKSREQMEAVVGQIAEAKINQQIKTGEMDARILAVREEFEEELAGYAQDIQLLMAAATSWAEANPQEFGKARSIEMVHATVGFRTGQPQLKTLKGWTWEKVLQAIKRFAWRRFIRTKQEVNKEAILNARTRLGTRMVAIGVQVAQDESFFVEPKVTAVETRETVENAKG